MLSEELFHTFERVSACSIAVPLLAGLIRIRGLNFVTRVLLGYIFIAGLVELIGFFQMQNKIESYWLRHVFTLLECSAFTIIYLAKFDTKRPRNTIFLFYLFFLALALVILVFAQRYNSPDSVLVTYESWYFMGISFAYFFKLIQDLDIPRLTEYYFAWFNTAIFVYFTLNFLVFLFYWYLEKSGMAVYVILYTPHLITNVAFNFLLAIALWTYKHR